MNIFTTNTTGTEQVAHHMIDERVRPSSGAWVARPEPSAGPPPARPGPCRPRTPSRRLPSGSCTRSTEAPPPVSRVGCRDARSSGRIPP